MDNLVYILFICLVAPLALMTLMLRKRSRLLIGYMLIGIFVSLFVSEVNTILLGMFKDDALYVTTTITPISEEELIGQIEEISSILKEHGFDTVSEQYDIIKAKINSGLTRKRHEKYFQFVRKNQIF